MDVDEENENLSIATYEQILAAPQGDQKFAQILADSGNKRLTELYKNLKHLNECEDQEKSQQHLFVIVKSILRLTINPYQINPDGLNDLVNGLLTEFRHFSTVVLSNCATHCLDYIKTHSDADLPIRWIEVFGKMVALLTTTRKGIKFEDDSHSGSEYRTEVIHALCAMEWKANNGPSLIAAIREIPGIDSNETTSILTKVSASLLTMDTSAVPPLVYQLLLLVGEGRSCDLINIFDKYFRADNDIGEINERKRKVLGTAVYHFIQAARFSPNLLKEMLRRIKISAYDHNLVMNRFSLGISLGLTKLEQMKQLVVVGLKNTILKSFLDSQLREDTLWYKESYRNPPADVVQCFVSVLQSKSSELEFMVEGLKDLAIGLLTVEEKDSIIADQCKALAIVIMSNVVQTNREYFQLVFNKLLKNQNLSSIECLAAVLKSMVRSVVDSSSSGKIHELISHLPLLTVQMAKPLIKALLPALQVSPALMGELIMVLRKTLWKSIEARRVSVTAMMMLLSNLRIITALPKDDEDDYLNESQMSQSQPAFCAPPTAERSTANELLCTEIVSILKRFFNQQCEVREQLYLGLDCVLSKNIELLHDISNQLLNQAKVHMSQDSKNLALFKVTEISSSGEVTVMEELGLLFQAICSVIWRAQKIYVGGDKIPPHITRCQRILDVWGTEILSLTFEDFEIQAADMAGMNGGALKSLDTVRYVRNILIVQILQVIESLLEFIIFDGKLVASVTVHKLFNKFLELEKSLKTNANTGQKDKDGAKKKKKKGDQENEPDSNASSASSAHANAKAAKKPKLEISKKIAFVHIIPLKRTKEILSSIYNMELSDASPLKPVQNADFEKYLLRIIRQKLLRLIQRESLKEFDHGKKFTVKILLGIASVLWEKVVKHKHDLVSYLHAEDQEVTLLDMESGFDGQNSRLEIILSILEYVYSKHSNCRKKLIEFTTGQPSLDYDKDFGAFINNWRKLFLHFQSPNRKGNTDGAQALLSILNLLALQLTPGSEWARRTWLFLSKKWMRNDGKPNEKPTVALVQNALKCFTTLLCKSSILPPDILIMAKNAHIVLGNNMESLGELNPGLTEEQKTWLITEETAPSVIHGFGLWIEKILKVVNTVITRIKFHSTFILAGDLAMLRGRCISMLNFVMEILTELVSSTFPCGQCGDILLKVLTQFFLSMSNMTEEINEFIVKKKQKFNLKRFEALVKEIGKDFKGRVESCIHYIELIQREQACELEEKRKGSKNKKDKKVPNTIIYKFSKDARTIPALVYSIEKFELQIISLATKAKVDLLVGTKLSSSRDFRIEMNLFKAALQNTTTSFNSNLEGDVEDVEEVDVDVDDLENLHAQAAEEVAPNINVELISEVTGVGNLTGLSLNRSARRGRL